MWPRLISRRRKDIRGDLTDIERPECSSGRPVAVGFKLTGSNTFADIRFNVAAADQPRKALVPRIARPPRQAASLWPRLISRGRSGAAAVFTARIVLQCGRG